MCGFLLSFRIQHACRAKSRQVFWFMLSKQETTSPCQRKRRRCRSHRPRDAAPNPFSVDMGCLCACVHGSDLLFMRSLALLAWCGAMRCVLTCGVVYSWKYQLNTLDIVICWVQVMVRICVIHARTWHANTTSVATR